MTVAAVDSAGDQATQSSCPGDGSGFARNSSHFLIRFVMQSLRQQRTISRSATVEGFGYWSGRDVRVEFRPSPPNTGHVFVRRDLNPARRIPATVEYRFESPRRTTLVGNGARVEMVEHILAALAGLRVDNCEILVDAPEMPGLDGSSLSIVEALRICGIQYQAAYRRLIVVRNVIRVGNDQSWVEARPHQASEMKVHYHLDFAPHNAIGEQEFEATITPETFIRDLAPARTFVLKEEAEWLRSQGLAQRASFEDLLVFDQSGPIDNKLRFDDECVRHKMLDLVGDLALAGCDFHGYFVATRSGHRLNAELVRELLKSSDVQRADIDKGTKRRLSA